MRVATPVPGLMVPVWRDGLDAGALAPDYRRTVEILAGRSRAESGPMDCRQLAVALGLEAVAAKVEGVRSKAKRLGPGAGWPRRGRGCSVWSVDCTMPLIGSTRRRSVSGIAGC
ncbi:hypothetical protein GCM10010495_77410 [Kitasatospora herbaricolor]|nr:hypothetical protein GCM10010495_77410 [Kitasatospora herbaricolor]